MAFILSTVWFVISLWAAASLGSAPRGPWDAFNYAPATRVVRPTAIFRTNGAVSGPEKLLQEEGKATLSGEGSYISLDFGKEVSKPILVTFLKD